MITPSGRDQEIGHARQLAAQQQAADVRIAQKVMTAHREAFAIKFPGQCEHIMRLIAERLQLGLRKDNPVELATAEIADLSRALNEIYQIHSDLKD